MRVITRYGTELRKSPTPDSGPARPKDSGAERETFSVYRIKSVDGRWVELISEDVLAIGWTRAENVIPYERAIDYYSAEIKAHPASELYNNRGNLWRDRGELDNAIDDFNEAIRLDPKNAAAYNNRGSARSDKNELDKAIADFDSAIEIDPKFASAYRNRGGAYMSKEAYGKALADFDRAIQLDPGSADSHNSRGWLLATCPDEHIRDGKRALESASRACELTQFRNIALIDTLAAAYAELGDFEQAVQWQESALNMLPVGDEANRKDFGSRLDLYRRKKPYRETVKPATPAPAPDRGA
jgi:tetratricopeptide (TPR) repeat protein